MVVYKFPKYYVRDTTQIAVIRCYVALYMRCTRPHTTSYNCATWYKRYERISPLDSAPLSKDLFF